MKYRWLFFFLVVGGIVVAAAIFPTSLHIADELVVSRDQAWKIGLAPVSVILGIILIGSSISAWKGFSLGFTICRWWALLYSVCIISIVSWYYPNMMIEVISYGAVWSLIWFLSTKKIQQ